MNYFNAPDVPITNERLTEAILDEVRTRLLQIQHHCLRCRLVGCIPHLFGENDTQQYLGALVELAARLLPAADLDAIECAALGAHFEARFLIRRTWAAIAEPGRP
ncbi:MULTISPECIES: hypothetical protein [Achromobacter]|uniref:hypothetical protein n=1 Tax=Achromobacter TaxID=222 RepID=UPI000B493ABE|nr:MULTISPECIES: hypothetical protein [Achromobacter]